MSQGPVCFQPMRGHLMPDLARVHDRAIEEERKHIADLGDGESFAVRYVVVKGRLKAIFEPKRIEIG